MLLECRQRVHVVNLITKFILEFIHTAVTHFNPENSFNMRALFLLEAAAGIPVMRTLNSYTQQIQIILGVQLTNLDLNALFNCWVGNVPHIPPTWKSLLLIIRLLNLDDLAQWMETHLSGSTGGTEDPHDHPEMEMEEVTEEKESKR